MTPGKHYLRAETAEDFAAAACRLIAEPELGTAVGRAGRLLVTGRHSLEAKAAERESIWGAVCAAE